MLQLAADIALRMLSKLNPLYFSVQVFFKFLLYFLKLLNMLPSYRVKSCLSFYLSVFVIGSFLLSFNSLQMASFHLALQVLAKFRDVGFHKLMMP